MSTVAEIEAAIKALAPAERERLAEDCLPSCQNCTATWCGNASLTTRVLVLHCLRWAIN